MKKSRLTEMWRKTDSDMGNSMCKGLEVGLCLACLRNRKKARVSRLE